MSEKRMQIVQTAMIFLVFLFVGMSLVFFAVFFTSTKPSDVKDEIILLRNELQPEIDELQEDIHNLNTKLEELSARIE